MTFSKTYNGPENEDATGPNFAKQYTLSADISAGQTLTDFSLIDRIPIDAVVDTDSVSCTPNGYTPVLAGDTLTVTWPGITGTTGGPEASCSFSFYFPQEDTLGDEVVPSETGISQASCNQGQAGGSWTPVDTRDGLVVFNTPTNLESGCVSPETTVAAKSIAIQKNGPSVVGGSILSPGDILQYTLHVQVSDFFGFDNLSIADILSDGQHFYANPDTGQVPQISVNSNGYSIPNSNISAANYTVDCNYSGPGGECSSAAEPASPDGTTTWNLNLSSTLTDLEATSAGRMLGGCVDPDVYGSNLPDCSLTDVGGTTATITFYTQVLENFINDYPSGDPSVDQGDVLSDHVNVTGSLLDVTDSAYPELIASPVSDGSSADATLQIGALEKSIYAINGSTSFDMPVKIFPKDTVTYRLKYTLPTSDEEDLYLEDYLPLPVFRVGDPAPDSGWSNWQFSSDPIPAAGSVALGPQDLFTDYSGITPVLSYDAAANSLKMSYGSFDDPRDQATVVDLLFTITVSSEPFADGLYLTNEAHAFESTTFMDDQSADAIVQIQLGEPVLTSKKAVVWTDAANPTFDPATTGPVTFLDPGNSPRWSGTINATNLADNPINSDLAGVDAGDLVTFALYVQNTGSSLKGAFDITLKDTLPDGFAIPAGGLNLQVYYGNGAASIKLCVQPQWSGLYRRCGRSLRPGSHRGYGGRPVWRGYSTGRPGGCRRMFGARSKPGQRHHPDHL